MKIFRKFLFPVLMGAAILQSPLSASAQCPSGDIVVADTGAFGVVHIPPTPSTSQSVIPGFFTPTSITSVGGKVYAIDDSNAVLSYVNCAAGTATPIATFAPGAFLVEGDPVTGEIYVASGGAITKHNPTTNVSSSLYSGLSGVTGMAVAPDGCLLVSELSASRVRKLPVPGRCTLGSPVTVLSAPTVQSPTSIAVHRATGDYYLIDARPAAIQILKVPASGSPFPLTAPEAIQAYGLAVNQDTGALYAVENLSGEDSRVVEVNTISGSALTLSQGNNISFPFALTVLGPECGNGEVEAGEQCDDGNTNGGDCCSPTCMFDAAESTCDDGQFCNGAEVCDGAGLCIDAGDEPACADSNPCTEDTCDEEVDECFNTALDDGTSCDDGNACTSGETCQTAVCQPSQFTECPITNPCSWTRCEPAVGCVSTPGPAPASAVISGAPSAFSYSNKSNNSLDLMKWTVSKLDATPFPALGNPTLPFGTEYGICFWQDAQPSGGGRTGDPVYSSLIMPGENDCGTRDNKSCWAAAPKSNPAQYNYSDGGQNMGDDMDENGVKQLIVKSGVAGKAKLQFQAKGPNVPNINAYDTVVQFKLPVVAQVCNSRGTCWQSVFETSGINPAPKKNYPNEFNMTVK